MARKQLGKALGITALVLLAVPSAGAPRQAAVELAGTSSTLEVTDLGPLGGGSRAHASEADPWGAESASRVHVFRRGASWIRAGEWRRASASSLVRP